MCNVTVDRGYKKNMVTVMCTTDGRNRRYVRHLINSKVGRCVRNGTLATNRKKVITWKTKSN